MKETYYIVWNDKKGGYYEKYSPLEDVHTPKYLDAKRYKSISTALNRVGFTVKIFQVRELIKKFDKCPSLLRQKKLCRLNGEKYIPNYDNVKIFDNHRIDIVEIEGNSIKLLGEIDKYVFYNYLLETEKKLAKKLPAKYIGEPLKNVEEGNINDDFWN